MADIQIVKKQLKLKHGRFLLAYFGSFATQSWLIRLELTDWPLSSASRMPGLKVYAVPGTKQFPSCKLWLLCIHSAEGKLCRSRSLGIPVLTLTLGRQLN